MNKYIVLLIALGCFGCSSHYVSVVKVPVDKTSLASTYAGTPDPKAKVVPKGEKLYISYRIPFSMSTDDLKIRLKVIYKNLEQEEKIFPIYHRIGAVGFDLVGDKFKKTSGFFTYKAELLDKDDHVIDCNQQRMWVDLLKLDNQ